MNPTLKQLDLIHYGTNKFKPEKIKPVFDAHWIKPRGGGFWASPVDAEWGWKQWCLAEQFHVEQLSQHILLTFRGNVLTIDSVKDLDLLSWNETPETIMGNHGIQFAAMLRAGIDAIHLTTKGQDATRHSRPKNLYGWDCESVLIMNPETLTEVKYCPDFTKPQPPIPARRRMITIRHSA